MVELGEGAGERPGEEGADEPDDERDEPGEAGEQQPVASHRAVDDPDRGRDPHRAGAPVAAEHGNGDREHVAVAARPPPRDLVALAPAVEVGDSDGAGAGAGLGRPRGGEDDPAGVDDHDRGLDPAGELVHEVTERGGVPLLERRARLQGQPVRVVLDAAGEPAILGLGERQSERERQRQEHEQRDGEVADEQPASHAATSGTPRR